MTADSSTSADFFQNAPLAGDPSRQVVPAQTAESDVRCENSPEIVGNRDNSASADEAGGQRQRERQEFRDCFRRGAMGGISICVFPFVFGVLFMTAALSRGFTGLQGMVMTTVVFAGSVLFAGMEIWNEPLPYLALAVTAMSVGSRHVLMGLTLPAYFARGEQRPPLLSLFFLTDLNWLLTTKAQGVSNRYAYFLGTSVVIYSAWVLGSLCGWGVVNLIDATTLRATRSMGAIFMGLLIVMLSRGFAGSRWPWLLAGIASACASCFSPKVSVLAGVLVGCLAAVWTTSSKAAGGRHAQ